MYKGYTIGRSKTYKLNKTSKRCFYLNIKHRHTHKKMRPIKSNFGFLGVPVLSYLTVPWVFCSWQTSNWDWVSVTVVSHLFQVYGLELRVVTNTLVLLLFRVRRATEDPKTRCHSSSTFTTTSRYLEWHNPSECYRFLTFQYLLSLRADRYSVVRVPVQRVVSFNYLSTVFDNSVVRSLSQ